LPKYRFQWDALPAGLLRRLANELELPSDDPAGRLRKTFGARPDEEFARIAWPALREAWLARDASTRRSVAIALRARGLGDSTLQLRTSGDQLVYLRSCRNGPGLRRVVLQHLLAAGEEASRPTKPVLSEQPAPSIAPADAQTAIDAGRSAAWPSFTGALAGVLALLEDDQFLIVSPKRHTNYYVQFAAQGPSGMRAETVSNAFLEEWEQLDSIAGNRLATLGWQPPTRPPAPDGSPRQDPDGSPNYFRDWKPPVPYDQVARIAVETLIQILDVSHPGTLCYRAFAEDGSPILLPTLAIRQATTSEDERNIASAPASDMAKVGSELDDALKEFLGAEQVNHDEDGDVPIRFGSAMVFVRLSDEPPLVSVFSPMLWEIPAGTELFEAINEVNGNIRFARAIWDGKSVSLRCEVPARPFAPEQTVNAVAAVGSLADEIGEQLQGRFGGRTYFGAALPPKEDTNPAGYL
jgi:hypothetical protein